MAAGAPTVLTGLLDRSGREPWPGTRSWSSRGRRSQGAVRNA